MGLAVGNAYVIGAKDGSFVGAAVVKDIGSAVVGEIEGIDVGCTVVGATVVGCIVGKDNGTVVEFAVLGLFDGC